MIDVDTGLDDALAILMLLAADAQKKVQLKGITCVGGNTSLRNVCVNTLRLLRTTNRLDVRKIKALEGFFFVNRACDSFCGLFNTSSNSIFSQKVLQQGWTSIFKFKERLTWH